MTRYDKIRHYIECIHASARDLTEWERDDFLPSVARQFNAKRDLSDKQLAILERIYSEKTPTGSPYGEPADSAIQNYKLKDSNEGRGSRRYEGFDEPRDYHTGRSSERQSWRDRGYDE